MRESGALRILVVSTSDVGGGAEAAAASLHRGFLALGHESTLAVGHMLGSGEGVVRIPNNRKRPMPTRVILGRAAAIERNGDSRIASLLRWVAEPIRDSRIRLGQEDFDFPATKDLPQLPVDQPDVIHLHNLHGAYFDLRELARLSLLAPTGITLHDQWMLTGHCAYSFECERWRDGCGSCPHLDTYPSVPRDATAFNLARKTDIYRKSRLHVSAPSKWLLDQVPDSALAHATATLTHLPYGVDQSVFSPGDKTAARAELGISTDARIVLFAANMGRANPFKDWPTVAKALTSPDGTAMPVQAYAIGSSAQPERIGNAVVHSLPRLDEPTQMATWYQAADLFLHAARADNFPLTILEAQSCGTPVVATATGGIPEQLVHLGDIPGGLDGGTTADLATGVLTSPGDGSAMGAAMSTLLADPSLLMRLGHNAARHADQHFGLARYVDDTLAWYARMHHSSSVFGATGADTVIQGPTE